MESNMTPLQIKIRKVRTPWSKLVLAGLVLLGPANTSQGAPLKARPVFESANAMAMAITHVGDMRVWVAQRNGTITVFPNKASKTGTVFMKVASASCLCIGDESGLIGLAFHPDFLVKEAYGYGRFYLYYTMNTSGHDGLFEYKVIGDPATSVQGDPASRRQLFTITDGGMHHNAGSLAFDNKKNLFFGVGDGNVPAGRGWAQSLASFHGKIMRINVDGEEGGKPYRIPADNPDWPGVGRNEIFAMGLRNPYRIHWDRAANNGAGALIVGDVGQTGAEEVNIVQAGKNYGWGNMEGRTCVTGDCSAYTPPLYLYPSGGAAIIGGVVYRGKAMPQRHGQYFFADYYYQFKQMDNPYVTGAPVVANISPLGKRTANADEIFSFGTDSEGEVYAMNWKGIYILEETTPTAVDPKGVEPKAAEAAAMRTFDLKDASRYEVRDLRGRPVRDGKIPGTGIYLVRARDGGRRSFDKVVVP